VLLLLQLQRPMVALLLTQWCPAAGVSVLPAAALALMIACLLLVLCARLLPEAQRRQLL
jgi:hypothetical protein